MRRSGSTIVVGRPFSCRCETCRREIAPSVCKFPPPALPVRTTFWFSNPMRDFVEMLLKTERGSGLHSTQQTWKGASNGQTNHSENRIPAGYTLAFNGILQVLPKSHLLGATVYISRIWTFERLCQLGIATNLSLTAFPMSTSETEI